MNLASLDALRGRRVLVTGHTGFKGSWLAIWLERLGAATHGYALDPPTTPSNFAASGVEGLLAAHTVADVRDAPRLRAALDSAEPDVVFHLAAQALVRESYAAPAETFAVNVQGTVNLLEAVRTRGRPCVLVVITSDKCYENAETARAYGEGDRLGGHDPYSASKGAAEIATSSYRRSFFDPSRVAEHGVKLATARAGNVIGGGDWAEDRLVPDVLGALAAGRPADIRNPGAIRPWQHVLEPLSGYLALAARMLTDDDAGLCSAWNFGPAQAGEVTVGDLARRIVDAWGGGSCSFPEDPAAPHEAGILRLAIEKAAAELRWRPRWNLDTAITRTVDWTRAFHGGATPDELLTRCREDIAHYESAHAQGDAA